MTISETRLPCGYPSRSVLRQETRDTFRGAGHTPREAACAPTVPVLTPDLSSETAWSMFVVYTPGRQCICWLFAHQYLFCILTTTQRKLRPVVVCMICLHRRIPSSLLSVAPHIHVTCGIPAL